MSKTKESLPCPLASFGLPPGKIEGQAEGGASFGKASAPVKRRARSNNGTTEKTGLFIAALRLSMATMHSCASYICTGNSTAFCYVGSYNDVMAISV